MTVILAHLEKTSVDRLDYDVDYGKWLTEDDVLTSATADILDPDVTFLVDVVEVTEQIARVWVSGGIAGEVSEIAVYGRTMIGRVKEARFELLIRDD